ncbi:hypothetical protein C8Q77DRAFT_426156 [Trametes polyzona]|nr:hypothetical protein C8Q77DRAFT_426156 [Trametes polyzona]
MCRLRQYVPRCISCQRGTHNRGRVRTIYKKCNHAVTAPDEEVQCDRLNCIFSINHPRVAGDSSARRTVGSIALPRSSTLKRRTCTAPTASELATVEDMSSQRPSVLRCFL